MIDATTEGGVTTRTTLSNGVESVDGGAGVFADLTRSEFCVGGSESWSVRRLLQCLLRSFDVRYSRATWRL